MINDKIEEDAPPSKQIYFRLNLTKVYPYYPKEVAFFLDIYYYYSSQIFWIDFS